MIEKRRSTFFSHYWGNDWIDGDCGEESCFIRQFDEYVYQFFI